MPEHPGRCGVSTSNAHAAVAECDTVAAMCAAHANVDCAGRFPAGTIFGEWRLTAFIGRGGNGEVYCAEHVRLGTPAAVKVLMREDERAKARFVREAKFLAGLKSREFPRFLASGEANGRQYLAMELLEPGELPTRERPIAKFMLKVCGAVAELHALGYVHRDIKPANILWRTGLVRSCATAAAAEPVLADLGLVKGVAASGGVPQPSSSVTLGGVGTPGYGAPEQMERGEVTPAADIHALGVLADRCFGGSPPRAWVRIIERATSSIPARRYPSVAAFARAIRWRHLPTITGIAVACVAVVAVSGSVLARLIVSHGAMSDVEHREIAAIPDAGPPPEESASVLFATATLNGEEAKDVQWFLDDNRLEMPYRFADADWHGEIVAHKWLRAVLRKDGKVYSAKKEATLARWSGELHLSLTLREDPAGGTQIRIPSPGGVSFDFVWLPADANDIDSSGYGCWLAAHGLTGRQLEAIVNEGLLYTPFDASRRFDSDSDAPLNLEQLGDANIPVFSFPGTGVTIAPSSSFHRGGRNSLRPDSDIDHAADGVRLIATTTFANETNTVLHCAALGLLRSDNHDDIAKGEMMLLDSLKSDDAEFADTAREICIARGIASLDECGANPPLRFRRAALLAGNRQTLERLAATDPDSDIRTEAYERILNPSQMLSAKFIAMIADDFNDDIAKPIAIIENMTDRAALQHIAANAKLAYFQELANERLSLNLDVSVESPPPARQTGM